MIYQSTFLIVISLLLIASCNPVSNDEPSEPAITPGFYDLEAQNTSINGEIVSAGPLGDGYFAEKLRFLGGDSLYIRVKSDIANENGLAEATYQRKDFRLAVHISASTTSRYSAGEDITFTGFKVVDESYSQTFESGDNTFTGPGLLLENESVDQQDLDEDGNTSEMVLQTLFYSYLGQKYDE